MDEPRRWRHILISLRLREVLPRVSLRLWECGHKPPRVFQSACGNSFLSMDQKMIPRSLGGTRGQGGEVLTLYSQVAPFPPPHTVHPPLSQRSYAPPAPAAGVPSKMTSLLPFPRARKEVFCGASQCLDPRLLTKMSLVKNMGGGDGMQDGSVDKVVCHESLVT